MRSIAYSLPILPFLQPQKTFATWPVWRDSTLSPVRYQPISKRAAVKLWHDARRLERQTRQPGRQDGALGRNGLAIIHVLLFDLLNHATGRLDPSYATIARHAIISPRSVARGLIKLKAAGVLNWVRRCIEDRDEAGRFRLRQESNAYAVLPTSQWHGFTALLPPLVEPWEIGAVLPLPDPIAAAVEARIAGEGRDAIIDRYKVDPRDKLALAWAGFLTALDQQP